MNKLLTQISKFKTEKQVISTIYSKQKANSIVRNHIPPTYSLDELTAWIYEKTNFKYLYGEWIKSGRITGLKPSIDRLNNSLPYSLNNIQMTTWFINHKLGAEVKRKPVLKFTLDGIFVKRYDKMMSAGEEHNDPTASMITAATNGKRLSTFGHIWIYEDEYSKEVLDNKMNLIKARRNDGQPRPVYLLDIKGNIITEFKSVADVASKTNLEDHIITRAAIGTHPTKSGLILLYKDLYSNKEILNNLLERCETELDRRVLYIDDENVEHIFSRPAKLYTYLKKTDNSIIISSLMYKLRCKNNKQFMYLKDL